MKKQAKDKSKEELHKGRLNEHNKVITSPYNRQAQEKTNCAKQQISSYNIQL
jgi:hypothetical protein